MPVSAVQSEHPQRAKGNLTLTVPKDTHMTNLLVALLDKVGVPLEKLGDSTGTIAL